MALYSSARCCWHGYRCGRSRTSATLQVGDVTTGNEFPTYAVFGGLAVLTLMLAMRENIPGLATLLSPALVLFAGWLCFTVLLSFDPSTSIRRFALTAFVVAVAASLPLLAKSQKN